MKEFYQEEIVVRELSDDTTEFTHAKILRKKYSKYYICKKRILGLSLPKDINAFFIRYPKSVMAAQEKGLNAMSQNLGAPIFLIDKDNKSHLWSAEDCHALCFYQEPVSDCDTCPLLKIIETQLAYAEANGTTDDSGNPLLKPFT